MLYNISNKKLGGFHMNNFKEVSRIEKKWDCTIDKYRIEGSI